MNWSWNVGTLAGIRVYIHWTLLALVALVGWSSRHAEGGALVGGYIGDIPSFKMYYS